MFSNIKNLFNEIIQVFKDTDFKKLYSNAICNTKEGINKFKYKINNLFETNLENGLMHYHSGHYTDALMRFKLMNRMWKNNYIIHYNIGRCYFILEKFDKAKIYFIKAFDFNPDEHHKKLINYYIQKIDIPSEIVVIPDILKQEFYDYSIDSHINYNSIHIEDLKKLFDLYNRYIGSVIVQKGESNTSILDIGCHIGIFGKLYKQLYKKSTIDGLDISKKMCEFCKSTTLLIENKEQKIYNNIINQEMHLFLAQNYESVINNLGSQNLKNNSNNNIKETKEKDNKNIELLNADYEIRELKYDDQINFNNKNYVEEISYYKNKFYDIMTAIGTFADCGELSAILKLCELNLNKNGILIFVVPNSNTDTIQFATNTDFYYYTEYYIQNTISENTKLKIVDIIHHNVVTDTNKQMIVVCKKEAL